MTTFPPPARGSLRIDTSNCAECRNVIQRTIINGQSSGWRHTYAPCTSSRRDG